MEKGLSKMATHEQVAHAFIRGAKANGSKTDSGAYRMFTADNVIYSYGYHYPLAKRVLPHVVILNVEGSSVSTAKHRSKVLRAIPMHWNVLECDGLEADWTLDHPDFKAAFVAYHEAAIEEAKAKQARARAEHMRDMWASMAASHEAQLATLRGLANA